MDTYTGPSAADLKRIDNYRAWMESFFVEVGKLIGLSDSHGAHRWFGDFEFMCDSLDIGVVSLICVTRAHLPQVASNDVRVRWEIVSPAEAAAAILAEHRRIRTHPMYVLTKRAAESLEEVD